MAECPICKNCDRNKFTTVWLEEYIGIYSIGALLCLACGIVFVEKEELDRYITHYYK